MTILTLNVRPDQERIVIDEDYDFVCQILESPNRYLRCHCQGKKFTFQKSFVFKIEDAGEESTF